MPNFDTNYSNIGASGIRGVAIYTKKTLRINEVNLDVTCHDHARVEIGTANGKFMFYADAFIGAHRMIPPLKDPRRVQKL